jgi:lipoyl(octanoyl) transferase
MDLEPFQRINPCGYAGLRVTQLAALARVEFGEVEDRLVQNLAQQLDYSGVSGDRPAENVG